MRACVYAVLARDGDTAIGFLAMFYARTVSYVKVWRPKCAVEWLGAL